MCLLSQLLSKVTVAVFTSNVPCVLLAAGRRTFKMMLLQKSSCFSVVAFKTLMFHKVV